MRIFLSHSKRDKPLVHQICGNLPQHITKWIDEQILLIGDDIESSIKTAIDTEIDLVLIFISRDSISSPWVKKELKWALKRERELDRRFVLPVLLDDASWSLLIPREFQRRKFIKCTNYDEASIKATAEQLKGELFAWTDRQLVRLQGDSEGSGAATRNSFQQTRRLSSSEPETRIENRVSNFEIRIIRMNDPGDPVGTIIRELETRKYQLLFQGYVSYEVAQLVAFTAYPDIAKNDQFSLLHVRDAILHAAHKTDDPIFRVNMVEIGGNLGVIRQGTDPKAKTEIAKAIAKVYKANRRSYSSYVEELCLVKLTILDGFPGKTELKVFVSTKLDKGQLSVYEQGIFENPEYWLPFVVGTPDIGPARFYAAYLIRKVPINSERMSGFLYHIKFLITSEKAKGMAADPDVIRELEQASEELLIRQSILPGGSPTSPVVP